MIISIIDSVFIIFDNQILVAFYLLLTESLQIPN